MFSGFGIIRLKGDLYMLFSDRITHINDLTDNEQRIAKYIENNLDAVSTMAIQTLASKTYTSHSAIVRFAKKLDYSGFRAMRQDINKDVQQNIIKLNDVDANFPFSSTDSSVDIAKNISDLTINAVKRTLAQINEKELNAAAAKIMDSKRLVLFAIGDTQIRARGFQSKLVKINKFAIIAEEYSDESWTSVNLDENDLAIFLSYTGNSANYLKLIKFLKQQKVPTLLVTGNPDSKMIQYASQTIAIIQNEYDIFKVSTFASQITFEYLLDTLFAIVYSQSYKKNLIKLQNNYNKLTSNNILDSIPENKKRS
ncbi:rpir family sialic acid utilization regulator [Companilactobacillus paralimentarius DSM 13238 = JCM 10415]|uniref:Rpir family sialic acid utilization regulator n=2 Tax=Companilactobacillus paralimentarius TaxID=83526 RepID=A0A0R1PDT3_9LACO|nr:rpir family sialic acid utilization regulator [Companilactobacillus paralimentarius DSM 13238 = JCM 10415]QFR69949.1 SIS domain-containing protein [Companilactobacillus paralimentarius]